MDFFWFLVFNKTIDAQTTQLEDLPPDLIWEQGHFPKDCPNVPIDYPSFMWEKGKSTKEGEIFQEEAEKYVFSGLRHCPHQKIWWSMALQYIKVCRNYNGPTKANKVRQFPILPPVQEVLERWKMLCPTKEGLVWPNHKGNMRAKGNDHGWSDRKEKGIIRPGHKTLAGISRHVRFHDLRHTCASHLMMGSWGTPWKIEEVCEYLGHSDMKVTLRYAHLSQEHLQNKASQTTSLSPRLIHELKPPTGIEPVAYGLRNRCSTN